MTESKEKLTRLLTKVKMSEKAGLYPTFKKMKITASDPIASWPKDGEPMEAVINFTF